MLAPDQDKCPSCGTRLRSKRSAGRGISNRPDFDNRDIFWLSLFMVGIALIPLILVVLVAFVCVMLGR
jgi:hypothetical protein